MHPMLNTAVKAARRAGGIINHAARNLDIVAVREKAANDFVTEVDRESEEAIIRTLLEAYPKHGILAEESGTARGNPDSDHVWIIDPLDGTTNFLHGFPQYAVSIALSVKGVITQAVIYNPAANDLYTATKGAGAYLNDARLRVSKRLLLKTALVGTGFPFKQHQHIDAYLGMLRDIMQNSSGVRRAGSAALDLAFVAAARLDAFWEIGLAPWDIAAGSLLITEAGGHIGDLQGGSDYLKSGNIVGGNLKLFAAMISTLAPHLTPALKGK